MGIELEMNQTKEGAAMSNGRKRRGEKNGRAKMTWEFVEYARTRWEAELESSLELACQASVSQSTMHDALTAKTWKRK